MIAAMRQSQEETKNLGGSVVVARLGYAYIHRIRTRPQIASAACHPVPISNRQHGPVRCPEIEPIKRASLIRQSCETGTPESLLSEYCALTQFFDISWVWAPRVLSARARERGDWTIYTCIMGIGSRPASLGGGDEKVRVGRKDSPGRTSSIHSGPLPRPCTTGHEPTYAASRVALVRYCKCQIPGHTMF